MKKLLLFCIVILSVVEGSVSAFSQLVVVGTGFDNYANTSGTAPAGWYMSWHSLPPTASSYTTASNSGVAIPSYKMGIDSVTVITPMYSNADTLSFMCKGNGVPFSDTNELHIYHSTDSITWNMFVNRDSLPTLKTTLKYGLPASSGWLKFVYRKLAGGNLAFDDVNIIAYPNIYAQFSNPGTICMGDSICFMDLSISNNGPLTAWSWSFGDGNNSILQNPCHTYAVPGTYTVTLIVNNSGGDADTTYSFATVNPSPTAGFSSNININTVTFTDLSTGAGSWYWDFGDANFSNTQNPVHAYASVGTYTVCLTVSNSFSCSATFCQVITITALGINDLNNASSITVFPTISDNGIFTIHSSLYAIAEWEVYTSVGEKLKRVSGETKALNLSDLPSGIYFLQLKVDSGIATKKIMIAK